MNTRILFTKFHCSNAFIKIQIGLTFLVPGYPVVLEKRPLNGGLSVLM